MGGERGKGYVTGGAGGGAEEGSQWGRPLLGTARLFRPPTPELPPPRPPSRGEVGGAGQEGRERTPGESEAQSGRGVRRGRGRSPAGEPSSPEPLAGSPGAGFGAPSFLARPRPPAAPLRFPATRATSHVQARGPRPPPPRSPGPAPPLPRRARLRAPLPGGGSCLPPLALTSSGLASLLFISASGSPADGSDGRRRRARPGGPRARTVCGQCRPPGGPPLASRPSKPLAEAPSLGPARLPLGNGGKAAGSYHLRSSPVPSPSMVAPALPPCRRSCCTQEAPKAGSGPPGGCLTVLILGFRPRPF